MRLLAGLLIWLLPGVGLVDMVPLRFETTCYFDGDGLPPWGITASGAATGPGIAAAGPRWEFGTYFLVAGHGLVRVEDRGGKITDRHLDVWQPTYDEAMACGRKTVEVLWIREEAA